ncbi:hypothetical protein B0H19DRAFT_1270609 [Mycena capillaripes]|nr:hypothetical protein B0H19DRAFT_1270609 [Mycena capillaripes]
MAPLGVNLLARLTLRVFSKPIPLGVGMHYASRRAGIGIPVWVTVILAVASLSLYVTYRVLRRDARQRAEAEAMGGRIAPAIRRKQMVYNRMHGYPGDGLDEVLEELVPL